MLSDAETAWVREKFLALLLGEKNLAEQRAIRPRHLLGFGRRDDFGAHAGEHLLHFQPRRADVARQRRRERRVRASSVERDLAGRGGERDQRAGVERCTAAKRKTAPLTPSPP